MATTGSAADGLPVNRRPARGLDAHVAAVYSISLKAEARGQKRAAEARRMIVIYGLKNCDSCRKARSLVVAAGAAHRFHDLRADGLPSERLNRWLAVAGWEVLLNRRSTTWRALPEADRAGLDAAAAARLLARHPTLIKRPVIEAGDTLIVGLAPPQEAALEAALSAQA